MKTSSFLHNTDLFRELNDATLRQVEALGTVRSLARNETLFLEGTEGTGFFLLLEGTIKIFKTSFEGKEFIMKLIGPGEIFAEVILFENETYPVSAMAVVQSKVFAIPKAPFLSILDHRDFRNDFIATLMKKQRYLAQRILYLSAYDVEERFFRFLSERYGKEETYHISLTKKEIASAIGTIPETLSRLLGRLKARGILEWDDTTISLRRDFWNDNVFE
jgi:CRP/FNR family transcriptional regulator